MKIKQPQSYLTFQSLDYLLEKPAAEYYERVRELVPFRLGPIVEFYLFDKLAATSFYRQGSSVATTALLKLDGFKSMDDMPAPTTSYSAVVEFFKCPKTEMEMEDARYDAFLNRFRHAAGQAGLEKMFTGALTATFGEMVDNLIRHSEAPHTAVIGYRVSRATREFEYVVADRGIGVLASLKSSPRYHYLLDSGQALEIAIRDGESRFNGERVGHGNGFQQLMRNIASYNSYLRFRSGDHSLTLDGIEKADITGSTRQAVEFRGFLISVVCRI